MEKIKLHMILLIPNGRLIITLIVFVVGVEETLKDQLIDSVEYTYLFFMKVRYIVYLGISVRYILYHLLLRYGKINDHDLVENMKLLKIPLDTVSPIDLYFKQVEDCR